MTSFSFPLESIPTVDKSIPWSIPTWCRGIFLWFFMCFRDLQWWFLNTCALYVNQIFWAGRQAMARWTRLRKRTTPTMNSPCISFLSASKWRIREDRSPSFSSVQLEECSGNAPRILLESYRDFVTTKSIPDPYPVSTFLKLGCPIPECSASRDGVPGWSRKASPGTPTGKAWRDAILIEIHTRCQLNPYP